MSRLIFWKKSATDNKSMNNYPACKHRKSLRTSVWLVIEGPPCRLSHSGNVNTGGWIQNGKPVYKIIRNITKHKWIIWLYRISFLGILVLQSRLKGHNYAFIEAYQPLLGTFHSHLPWKGVPPSLTISPLKKPWRGRLIADVRPWSPRSLMKQDGKRHEIQAITVVPTKSDSDIIFCLQLLNKTLTCTLYLS